MQHQELCLHHKTSWTYKRLSLNDYVQDFACHALLANCKTTLANNARQSAYLYKQFKPTCSPDLYVEIAEKGAMLQGMLGGTFTPFPHVFLGVLCHNCGGLFYSDIGESTLPRSKFESSTFLMVVPTKSVPQDGI
ncbi:unnamed protein product [Durusdinium trenchii]|uniref:Uncharacterized protein n=1 Tax=Durusdinium trenchii TaxID=1381693 RepID=A0ABP0RK57_9DINO